MTTPTQPQLVVALEHRNLVELSLRAADVVEANPPPDVVAGVPKVNEALGLVLFTMDANRLRHRAVRIRRRYVNEIAAQEVRGGRSFTDTDLLLFDLRRTFAMTHGMVPLMGKNRDVAMVYPQAVGDPAHTVSLDSKHAVDAHPLSVADIKSPEGVEPGDGEGVVIGMVDAKSEPDPATGLFQAWAGHTPFVRGLISREAPGAELRVREGLSGVSGESTSWDVAEEIVQFPRDSVDIMNLSLGVTTEDDEPPLVLRRAIDKLGVNVLVVAAAGNRAGMARMSTVWPAAMTDVVAVGATTEYRSQFSPRKFWVDLTAPGVDVISDFLDEKPVEMADGSQVVFKGAAMWTGTSFSSATVSGVVAAKLATMRRLALDHDVTAREALEAVLREGHPRVARYVHVPSD